MDAVDTPAEAYEEAIAELLVATTHLLPPRATRPKSVLESIARCTWLRFAIGADERGPLPDDLPGVTAAASEFSRNAHIWDAYRKAEVELRKPSGTRLRFALKRHHPEIPVGHISVVTAWNPISNPNASEADNRAAHARLAAEIAARRLSTWSAENAPDTPHREEAFAIFGLRFDDAFQLAEMFDQRAIYFLDGGRPSLVARRRGRVIAYRS